MELFLNRFKLYDFTPYNILRLSSETEIILNRKMHRFTEIMNHLKNTYRKRQNKAIFR